MSEIAIPHIQRVQRAERREMSFPFRIDANGRVAEDQLPSDIARSHIHQLLLTSLQERVMRPTYGTGVQNSVFDVADGITLDGMVSDVSDAIEVWEPDVTVVSVEPSFVSDHPNIIGLNITYSVMEEEGQSSVHTAFIEVGGTVTETYS